MADKVYEVELTIGQITAICSCGRVRLTLSGTLRENDTQMMAAAIQQHQAQYRGEENNFTWEVGGQAVQPPKEAH